MKLHCKANARLIKIKIKHLKKQYKFHYQQTFKTTK